MNNARTEQLSISRAVSIGLAAVMAALAVPLTAQPAGAVDTAVVDTETTPTDYFTCQAGAVILEDYLLLQPSVSANYSRVPGPCEDDGESATTADGSVFVPAQDVEVPDSGDTSESYGGVTVTANGAFARTNVEDDRGAAEAGMVEEFTIEHPAALPGVLRVQVASSKASATCSGNGAVPVLTGSSKVLSATLDGVELLGGPLEQHKTIGLMGMGALDFNHQELDYFNHQELGSGSLKQQAFRYIPSRIVSQGPGVILGQSEVGYVGNPCATDEPVAVSVSDAPPVAEGSAALGHAPGYARFTVSLSKPATADVMVPYATAPGTAKPATNTAPGDYTSTSGTLTFLIGETSKEVAVPVTLDTSTAEADEDFFLDLDAPTTTAAAVLGDARGKAVIYNNLPTSLTTISVDDVAVIEGNAGTTQAVFTVSLSRPSAAPVSVRAVTLGVTAHAAPHSANDFIGVNQTLNFARDETTKQVAVTVNGDTMEEQSDVFSLQLEAASGAQMDKRVGTGTITNDDQTMVAVSNMSVTEPDYDTTDQGVFTISLSAPSHRAVTVEFSTTDGTARSTNSSTLGSAGHADYNPVPPTSVTFSPGETAKTVAVTVIGDRFGQGGTDAGDEHFFLQLTKSVNAIAYKRVGVGTIVTRPEHVQGL